MLVPCRFHLPAQGDPLPGGVAVGRADQELPRRPGLPEPDRPGPAGVRVLRDIIAGIQVRGGQLIFLSFAARAPDGTVKLTSVTSSALDV